MLLACGFLAGCFSVDAFAADDSGTASIPLSGGTFTISTSLYDWQNNSNLKDSLYSSGTFNDINHTAIVSKLTSVTGSTINDLDVPWVNFIQFNFDTKFHVVQNRRYVFQLVLPGINDALMRDGSQGSYGDVTLSFIDPYNNVAWSTTGFNTGASGFVYWILDSNTTFDVSTIRIAFREKSGWGKLSELKVGGQKTTWMQLIRVADTQLQNTDDIVKKMQEQIDEDQKRYDDFTSDGSQQGSDSVDSTQSAVSEKIGILDFAEGVLSDFIGLFSDTPGDATLTLPGFKWHDSDTDTDLTVWEPQTFDFAFVEEHFGPLVSALRVGTVLTVYGALLWYLQAVFDRIFGGGDGN